MNARLIAAAPDMLAALQSIVDAYQQHFDVMPVAWQTFDTIARESGLSWHCTSRYADPQRWDSDSGLTCAFIEIFDNDTHGKFSNINAI